MGKVSEKQIKAIEDQGKKQVDISKSKELEALENKSDDNKKHLKYNEVFNELVHERINETNSISKRWFS